MAKDENEVVEIEDAVDDDLDVDEVGDDVGIFDEDLSSIDDSGELDVEDLALDGDLVLGEDDGEGEAFFIGDTILSAGNGEESWSKEDLEEVLRNERIERDWQDSEEFVGGDFYNAVNGDFYGASGNRDGFYETERGGDLYKGDSGGDVYNTGDVYAGKSANEEGVYDVSKRGEMKSYDEVADNRRKGRSVLEMVGFEDKEKQKDRDTHNLMKYEGRKAA